MLEQIKKMDETWQYMELGEQPWVCKAERSETDIIIEENKSAP